MEFSLLLKYIIFNSLLWSVDGSTYLFGTYHAICEVDSSIIYKINPYISKCDTLYFEMDITQSTNEFLSKSVSASPLVSYFTEDQYKTLENYLHVRGIPINQLTRTDIHFIPFILSNNNCHTIQMEQFIFSHNHIPIKGLETISEQINTFMSVAPDSIVSQIMIAIEHPEFQEKSLSLYRNQQIVQLYLSIQNKELLINSRNRSWITTIEHMTGKNFIAVGAAHLPTLILMLRAKGHKVEPISL